MDTGPYHDKVELLKALAHPTRLCIVHGLVSRGECNVSGIQHCLEMPQSTVSQQLAILKLKGIVRSERSGTEVRYSVGNDKAREIVSVLFENDVPFVWDKAQKGSASTGRAGDGRQ
jgi:ArsR family transcriptional regulator